jgi:NAD-dependent dihydropyrimidine dehydrogenase PreA subunit
MGMHDSLFETALGITPPWFVAGVRFDEASKVLTVGIDFIVGTRFTADGAPGEHPVHDTLTKTADLDAPIAKMSTARTARAWVYEKNCAQCGLCAITCLRDTITLAPRLWLADGGCACEALRVLHEDRPCACVRCGKPFGTARAAQAMAGRLAGHAAFQGAAGQRLRMCNDCRVIDIFDNPDEVRIDQV